MFSKPCTPAMPHGRSNSRRDMLQPNRQGCTVCQTCPGGNVCLLVPAPDAALRQLAVAIE